MRICSLLPSATEIVGALGLASSLVAVSQECDWPPQVRGLPIVTAARLDTRALGGREIDRAVRTALAEGRPLYAVDEELIERLRPDVILTQDLCEVCAVSSKDVCAVDAQVVSLDARTIGELEQGIVALAERLGVRERGAALVEEFRAKLARVEESVHDLERRRTFVAEWLDPPFAAGHWVPEMVARAGGEQILGRAGEASYATSWKEVRAGHPELVVLAPCGYDAGRAAREAEADVPTLPCRIVAVDAQSYYSRAGPRLADGVAQLAFLLHPGHVPDPGLPWLPVAA